jgi:hypothetical protein
MRWARRIHLPLEPPADLELLRPVELRLDVVFTMIAQLAEKPIVAAEELEQ